MNYFKQTILKLCTLTINLFTTYNSNAKVNKISRVQIKTSNHRSSQVALLVKNSRRKNWKGIWNLIAWIKLLSVLNVRIKWSDAMPQYTCQRIAFTTSRPSLKSKKKLLKTWKIKFKSYKKEAELLTWNSHLFKDWWIWTCKILLTKRKDIQAEGDLWVKRESHESILYLETLKTQWE